MPSGVEFLLADQLNQRIARCAIGQLKSRSAFRRIK
jgi:hypothetical protein